MSPFKHQIKIDPTKPTLYLSYISGPSRGVLLVLKKFNLLSQFNIQMVDSLHGETRTPEFIAITPFHTVPTLVTADKILTLYESTAIFEYINEVFNLDGDFGFANDNIIEKYKQINMLHKYHNLLAPARGNIVRHLGPAIAYGAEVDRDALQQGVDQSKKDYFPIIETLLQNNGGYLAGPRPSVVDVHFWVDMFLLSPNGPYSLWICDFSEFPCINKWLQNVKDGVLDEEIYNGPLVDIIENLDKKSNGTFRLIK